MDFCRTKTFSARVSKIRWLIACSALLLVFPSFANALTYSPIPMVNPEKVVADTRPVLDYLSRELGRPIRINYPINNAEVVKAFEQGRVDLAEIGPLPYLVLRELVPEAVAVLFYLEEGGNSTYTCALTAPFDGAAAVGDLPKEGRIALATTQMLSTCGPLAAAWMLQEQGLDIGRADFSMVGNHEAVALAIARAEFALGGMKTLIALRYHHLGVRVLAETPPLPVFALVANGRTLSGEMIAAIADALMNAPAEERARWRIGRYGFVGVDPEAYRPLELMLESLGASPLDYFQP
jgi:phosphonate transport system substrate-binding protein